MLTKDNYSNDLADCGLVFSRLSSSPATADLPSAFILRKTRKNTIRPLTGAFCARMKLLSRNLSKAEFSVGVIEGKGPSDYRDCAEERFYDYKNKYTAGSTVETCPGICPRSLPPGCRSWRRTASRALYLDSYARLDFMMKEGRGNVLP